MKKRSKIFTCNFDAVRSLSSHLHVEACFSKLSGVVLVYENEDEVGVGLLLGWQLFHSSYGTQG